MTDVQMKLFKQHLDGEKNNNALGGLQFLLGQNKQVDNAKTMDGFGIEFDSGSDRLTVKSVADGSPAAELGIQVGDVVDEINGEPVDTLVQINGALKKEGKIGASVIRDGKTLQLESGE